MTAGSATAAPAASGLRLPLALSIALRELRAGAGGLTVFVLCIALGVAAVAAIGSLAASFEQALTRQGRLLIGGDLSFELINRQANAEERAALDALGQVSESASFRAMARASSGKTALVEVKAVDDAYPLYGEVAVLEPDERRRRLALPRRGAGRARSARSARRRDRQPAHHRRGQRHHRRHPRRSARPARRSSRLWAEAADVARDAGAHRAVAARQPDSLDLSPEASRGARVRQGGAQGGAPGHREQVPAKRLRHPRLDRSRAVAPPRRRPLHPIRQLCRADRAPARRHRRRQRHSELHGEEARDHRHLQMSRRVEPARARRLSPPGAAAGARRHRHRPRHRRAYAFADRRALCRRAADHARGRAASAAAAHRRARRPAHHGAVRALAARPRRKRLARGADARPSQRRARALGVALCAWLRGGGLGVVRACHRRIRGARHHRLDLRRHRLRLSPPHRLRPAGAALRGKIPPRQAAFARARARQHRRAGIARPLDCRLARSRAGVARRGGADPPLAARRDREQYRGRRTGLLLPRCRGRRSRRLQAHGAGHRACRQAR